MIRTKRAKERKGNDGALQQLSHRQRHNTDAVRSNGKKGSIYMSMQKAATLNSPRNRVSKNRQKGLQIRRCGKAVGSRNERRCQQYGKTAQPCTGEAVSQASRKTHI